MLALSLFCQPAEMPSRYAPPHITSLPPPHPSHTPNPIPLRRFQIVRMDPYPDVIVGMHLRIL